jgi:hypothetical protein
VKTVATLGFFVVALVSLCLSPCLPHDLKLVQVKKQYRALSHPAASRAIAFEADLGLLEGNGNHCDYFVGELRATKVPLANVRLAYGPEVEVEAVDAVERLYVSSVARERLYAVADQTKLEPGEQLYVVSISDQEPPGYDLRCH